MAEGPSTKSMRDGAGAAFSGDMYENERGILVPMHIHAVFSTPADAEFTRPANTTAYAIGDLIANSETAGSVDPLSFTGATKYGATYGGKGRISKFKARKSGTAAALIRYHFMKTDHAVTNGDNGALVFTSLDLDNHLGWIDVNFVGTYDAIGASGGLVAEGLPERPIEYVLSASDTIYVFAQALSAFTPGSAEVYGGRPIFEKW